MQTLLRLLSDPTRLRILAAVEGEELAVNEIADVLGMGQSRISNHLRLLKDAEALHGRREGHWTFYRNALADPDSAFHALWTAVRAGVAKDPHFRSDAVRRRAVLERRRRRSREHFALGNGRTTPFERDCLREEIVAALCPTELVVVDAGCGDGFLTEALAERFDRVLAFDHSPERLAQARERVGSGKVSFKQAELDDLPIEDASCDAVFLSLVLHHVPEVSAALVEAARVLRPGGTVVVADLAPHDEESMRERMGDLRLGLDPREITRALEKAGFKQVRLLPVQDRIVLHPRKNLELFLATGTRPKVAAARRRSKTKTSKRQAQGSRS